MGFHFNGVRHGFTIDDIKKNVIWVIVDQLTKSSLFVPIHDSWTVDRLAQLYVKEVVGLHGVPIDIISERDSYSKHVFGRF